MNSNRKNSAPGDNQNRRSSGSGNTNQNRKFSGAGSDNQARKSSGSGPTNKNRKFSGAGPANQARKFSGAGPANQNRKLSGAGPNNRRGSGASGSEDAEQVPDNQPFKSQQTIIRRRRRRNPYALSPKRHYAKKTKEEILHDRLLKGRKIHRRRRVKEIGIPCSSSETDSSDLSRVSNLSEFTTYSDQNGKKILRRMLPVLLFARLFGQLPLTWRTNKNGTVTFYFRWWHPLSLLFLLIGILTFCLWGVSVWNYYSFQMRVPNGTRLWTDKNITAEERFTQVIIDRNLVPFFVVMLGYMAVWIITLSFMSKTTTLANYFSYWSRALILIKMDASWHLWQYSIFGVAFYLTIFALMIWLHFWKLTATAVGAPTVTALLLVRIWRDGILERTETGSFSGELKSLQWIGTIIVIYVYMAPKVYMLLFLFKQKLLQNCFQKWNGRAYAGALMEDTKINKIRGRCTYKLLFRDHCVIIDLLQETSRAFGGLFEAVLVTDCISVCLQLYLFTRDWKYGKRQQQAVTGNYFMRPFDWVVVFVYLTGNVIMMVISCVVASEVTEAAQEGMDIIRRKPLIGRRQDDELFFIISMFASFTSHRPLEFGGGGLFYINKDFIQGIASTIFSYYIILLQFMPPLDTDHDNSISIRADLGHFLTDFERLTLGHWKPLNFDLEFEIGPTNATSTTVSSLDMETTAKSARKFA